MKITDIIRPKKYKHQLDYVNLRPLKKLQIIDFNLINKYRLCVKLKIIEGESYHKFTHQIYDENNIWELHTTIKSFYDFFELYTENNRKLLII